MIDGLTLRCLHCGEKFAIDTSAERIICPGCGIQYKYAQENIKASLEAHVVIYHACTFKGVKFKYELVRGQTDNIDVADLITMRIESNGEQLFYDRFGDKQYILEDIIRNGYHGFLSYYCSKSESSCDITVTFIIGE